jgi:hypothetical protein
MSRANAKRNTREVQILAVCRELSEEEHGPPDHTWLKGNSHGTYRKGFCVSLNLSERLNIRAVPKYFPFYGEIKILR